MTSPFDADLTPDPAAGYVAPAQPTGPFDVVFSDVAPSNGLPYTFSVYDSLTGLFTGMTNDGLGAPATAAEA